MKTVFFEIYGKKLKVQVDAKDDEEAKYLVRGAIKFHKITSSKKDEVDFLKDMFGI